MQCHDNELYPLELFPTDHTIVVGVDSLESQLHLVQGMMKLIMTMIIILMLIMMVLLTILNDDDDDNDGQMLLLTLSSFGGSLWQQGKHPQSRDLKLLINFASNIST